MYPLRGDLQDLSQKKGVEVDVKGWGDVMEGASRRKSPPLPLALLHHQCLTPLGTAHSPHSICFLLP
jgi:hypothetical protein